MKLTSPAFRNGDRIPPEYSFDGLNHAPPLHLEGIPANARSLALIMDDPDASKGTFTHWLLYNWNPQQPDIVEDTVPTGAAQGLNDFKMNKYGGPKPPTGEHHYYFKVFALDIERLTLKKAASRSDLEAACRGHILNQATLMGTFSAASLISSA